MEPLEPGILPPIGDGTVSPGPRASAPKQPMKEVAKQKAVTGIETGKAQLSSALENFAHSLGRIEGDDPLSRRFASTASRYSGELASYLNQRSADELIDSLRVAVRNRPGLLIAGCFALGFAASRLVRT